MRDKGKNRKNVSKKEGEKERKILRKVGEKEKDGKKEGERCRKRICVRWREEERVCVRKK